MSNGHSNHSVDDSRWCYTVHGCGWVVDGLYVPVIIAHKESLGQIGGGPGGSVCCVCMYITNGVYDFFKKGLRWHT